MIEVRKNEASIASALPDPMIMADVAISEMVKLSGVGVSQMIMWPGKLIAMKRAGLKSSKAKEYQLTATMATIEADVRMRFDT